MPFPRTRPSKRYRPHVPLDKRKRAVRACISCRDGKKKCVLTSENQCRSCTRAGQACIFETKPKHRDDTRSQEPLKWNNAFTNHLARSSVWETVAMDVSRSFHEGFPGINLDPEQFSMISKLFQEAVQRNELRLVPESDSPGGESSTSLNWTPRPRVNMESQSIGSSATAVVDSTPSASHASFLKAVSDTISPVHVKGQDSPVHLSSLAQEEDAFVLLTVLNQLPPYEDAQALVDVFFTYLESNWYYFDEKWFRNLLIEMYMNKACALRRKQCTAICLVLLVLALGRTFEHLSRPANLLDTDREIPGRTFFAQATKLLPRVIATNSVESAICCLLTSLYLLATEDISHHHIYLGLALNLAVNLSLHRMGMGNDETPQAHEMKVRLFWTIYSIERQTSVIMGLPTMLQLKDITVPLPQRRQDLDKDGFQRVDRLVAFTTLTMIMDEIINAGPIEQSSTTFDWACSKLESWKQSVPAHLLSAQESSFRANAHLNIGYNMIWVNMGRGVILRLVRKRLHPEAAGSRSPEGNEMYLRSQKLAERCTESATIVIDWISQLHSRDLLARFSFTDIHTCSSAIIMLLLIALLRSPYHQLLHITRGIEALRFMADGSTLAMNALQLVERLQGAVYKSTSVVNTDSILHQQPPSLEPLGQNLSQSITLNPAGGVPYVAVANDTACEITAPDIAPLDLTLFADLEPSLLDYSDQYLALFGFDGFGSTLDPNFAM
ncbi:C6 transcription factor [Talaromyces proteolyticus]|uniref:C6 transcription factor n=1 Tax=Talaromyces proteolyticus TaxID=1131652 RepID=A0AAD4PSZ0_9EURO|nr:C6 transcription factor [Talaromyces proteolyticus]KAH8689919.1 C6 transcription factor [Talaromyces proteolyticus]